MPLVARTSAITESSVASSEMKRLSARARSTRCCIGSSCVMGMSLFTESTVLRTATAKPESELDA
jgi:hypothetical protein